MAYLTPNDPPVGTVGVVVFLPNTEESLYTLMGALQELQDPGNWQAHGSVTPEEIAAEWALANEDTAVENYYS